MLEPVKPLQIDLTPTQKLIISVCRKQGKVSKAEISKIVGVRSGTITNACKDLLALNIIREHTSLQLGGRGKPVSPIDLNPYGAFSFGVAFRVTSVEVTLANFYGNIIDCVSLKHLDQDEALDTINRIHDTVSQLTKKHGITGARILGMGVSISGPFVKGTQMVQTVKALSHWRDVDFKSVFGEKFEFPVWIDNDCNVSVVGEFLSKYWSIDTMVLIDLGQGTGAGIIIDGKLYTGSNRNAGEIGSYFDRVCRGKRPSIRTLLDRLKSTYDKDFRESDIPDIDDPIVNAWLDEAVVKLSPIFFVISALLEPDCIVISGTCPTFLAEELISRMDLFGDTEQHKFEYPLTVISPSRVGEDLSSYSAAMIPIYHSTQ